MWGHSQLRPRAARTPSRRARLAAAVGALLLAGTACSEGTTPRAGEELGRLAPRAALTRPQADAAVDRYEQIATEANRALDAGLLAQVEAGSMLQRSTARLRKAKAVSGEPQRRRRPEVSYEEREFYLPDDSESWFLVSAVSGTDDERHQRLLTFAERGGQWKLVSALEVLAGDRVPDIAVSEAGLVTAVPADDTTGRIAPAEVGGHIEEAWEARGEPTGDALDDTAALEDLRREAAEKHQDARIERSYRRIAPDHPEIHALRTLDGGTLAILPLGHEMVESVRDERATLVPSEEAAAFGVTAQSSITSTYHGEAAVYLPPGDRGAQLVTYEYEMTNAE